MVLRMKSQGICSAALAVASFVAVVASCSSSSGPSSFGRNLADAGSDTSSSGGGSSGVNLTPSVPMCDSCSPTALDNDGGSCPYGWVPSGAGCLCFLPAHACTDPLMDCPTQKSVCLAEAVLDGAGERCHCSCPMPSCS
jgi:hypothetical protein